MLVGSDHGISSCTGTCAFGGLSEAFCDVCRRTAETHDSILKFPLGGEGEKVSGLGHGAQLEVPRGDLEYMRCERSSRGRF